MPAKSNRSDYAILLILGVASVICIAALFLWAGLREDKPERTPVRSTRISAREGTMAYYMLLERLEMSVRRLDDPLLDERLHDLGVLFLIDPLWPLEDGESAELDRWVRRGGVLICTRGEARKLEYLSDSEDEMEADDILGRYDGYYGRKPPRNETTVPAESQALALARDVKRVHFRTSNAFVLPESAPEGDSDRLKPLLVDSEGVRISARRVGKGQVVILTDSSFFANGWLGDTDNAILAVNLAAYALHGSQGRTLAFDEYHFAHGSRRTGWTAMTGLLFTTSAGWAALCVTAAGILFLVYRGRRFGSRHAPQRARRRSKLEYVHAVGATFRAVGANYTAMRLIFNWFKGRCAEQVGLPESVSARDLAVRLAWRTGMAAGRYEQVFETCEAALAEGWLTRRRFYALLGELLKMEREIFDANSTRK